MLCQLIRQTMPTLDNEAVLALIQPRRDQKEQWQTMLKVCKQKDRRCFKAGLANTSVKCELVAASSLMEVLQTIKNEWLCPGSNTAFILYINISNQYNFYMSRRTILLAVFFFLKT